MAQAMDGRRRPRRRGGVGSVRRCAALSALAALALTIAPASLLAQRGPKGGQAKATAAEAHAREPGDGVLLAQFHARLAALEAHRRDVVAVLQIGDSHTAADHLSGRLRSLLQQRFGSAGRGFLPPGAPHAWYRPYQVSVTQSAGWRTLTSNRTVPDAAPFGLSGLVAQARDPEDTITIDTRGEMLRAVEIGFLTGPGQGSLDVLGDGIAVASLPAAADSEGHGSVRVGLPAATRRIELRPHGDGPVALTDHSLIGAGRGVTLSNLGFSGAQVSILSRWTWPRAQAQIADLDPALIILAFGTNEGHAPTSVIEGRYAGQFRDALRRLKAAAPRASLVVIGPPDANRYPKFCLPKPVPPSLPAEPANGGSGPAPPSDAASGASSPAAASSPASPAATAPSGNGAPPLPPPPPEPPADAVCEPLSPQERASYDRLMAGADRQLCRWHTPASIALVRAIEHDVAASEGALFFDWFELFDGECGADRWFRRGLAQKDRVHFKQDGYWQAADRLYARLMAGYAPRAQRGG